MRLALAQEPVALFAFAFAVFEALLADLVFGDHRRLAAIECELLLVELLEPQFHLLLELVAPPLFFLEAQPRRVGQRLESLEPRLTLHESALLILNASCRQLVDWRGCRFRDLQLVLGAADRRFEPVQLCLARGQLELATVKVVVPRVIRCARRASRLELERTRA
jgi:hypothetical protein